MKAQGVAEVKQQGVMLQCIKGSREIKESRPDETHLEELEIMNDFCDGCLNRMNKIEARLWKAKRTVGRQSMESLEQSAEKVQR